MAANTWILGLGAALLLACGPACPSSAAQEVPERLPDGTVRQGGKIVRLNDSELAAIRAKLGNSAGNPAISARPPSVTTTAQAFAGTTATQASPPAPASAPTPAPPPAKDAAARDTAQPQAAEVTSPEGLATIVMGGSMVVLLLGVAFFIMRRPRGAAAASPAPEQESVDLASFDDRIASRLAELRDDDTPRARASFGRRTN